MNWLKRFFGSIKNYLFSGEAEKRAEQVLNLVDNAMAMVRVIARMTPTRSDDELIKLYDTYAVPNVQIWLGLPPEKRGPALMEVGVSALSKAVPSVERDVVRMALQTAFFIIKGNEK